jgi:hypothetical protein
MRKSGERRCGSKKKLLQQSFELLAAFEEALPTLFATWNENLAIRS